jgi:hypothetical protein
MPTLSMRSCGRRPNCFSDCTVFVIQILDDADVAFRISGTELRTVLSATTMLADEPPAQRAIARRFSALARNGQANAVVACPLLKDEPT